MISTSREVASRGEQIEIEVPVARYYDKARSVGSKRRHVERVGSQAWSE